VVAQLGSMLTVLRWGTLSLALALAVVEHDNRRTALAGGVLVAYTLWRTVRPVGYAHGAWKVSAALLLEVAVGVAVVEATGFGKSPFLIFLGVAAILAGFTGGLPVVAGVAGMAAVAVVLPTVALVSDRTVVDSSIQFAIELVLTGVVGGFSRYLLEEARQASEGLVAEIDHLGEVNELLFDLHRATEHEATPLHLDGAARWALEHLEEIFAPDSAAVVLFDPATSVWSVAAGSGVRVTDADRTLALQGALARAASALDPVMLDDTDQGLSFRSRWGLYGPMRARGRLVGVLAVESDDARRTTAQDRRHMNDLARAAALALDNARWLERIRTLGVEQERTRLARELHDHIGQSVVYFGFELDRLVQMSHDRAVQRDLAALRGDVRNLVEELRDMLVDLRCDVSDDRDVQGVLESFLDRVNRRGRVKVTLTADVRTRLPLPVEREFWRVAREAVMNAERHARASEISVLWACSRDGAVLEVSDDGVGMPAGKAAGVSGYGLIGMRERADSVGAQLEITSAPEKGTTVAMRLRAERCAS
jgi:signal transduction histidine kinase